MSLPHANNAVVDIRKLRHYCLDITHDEGKHKARVFLSALGLTVEDAEALQIRLLKIARTHPAISGFRDDYGQRYTIDFWLEWYDRRARIRSGWIIEHGSTTPRLTSCFVL
ncbi:MAG: hypothetical protein GKR89_05250 [Candidatus Latescibacteria bacterium]|nr:hypothetical protein [Candidatus Latescibacterota bacterium]